MKLTLRLASCVLALASAACGSLPREGASGPVRLIAAAHSPEEVFGHTIEVHTDDTAYVGELLGCDELAVFLRLHILADDAYRRLPWTRIVRSHVAVGAWGGGALAWSIVGTVATASHGIIAIGTAPAWALVGTLVTSFAFASGENERECTAIRRYARFPQGVPPAWYAHVTGNDRAVSGVGVPAASPVPIAPTELPAIDITAASASPAP